MILGVELDCLREFLAVMLLAEKQTQVFVGLFSYTAVVKSLAAKALFPSALKASAIVRTSE